MESNFEDQLKKLSKDEKSFEELKSLFAELNEEKKKFESHLELLESAIKNDYDSILITEVDLEKPGPKIVYVNDGFCKMTGYSKEEVIGKTPRILQGPKTDRDILETLKKRLLKGQCFFGKAINYKKDGSEFVNQWDIHPLTDEQGNLTHWVSYQHDITERKRAEEMLVDTQVEFDGLREESNRTILDVDLHGNIVMANKAFRELIGFGKDELKRIKVWDLFPKRYRESLQSRFEGGLSKEKFGDQHFKGIIKHKSGVPIQIEGNTKVMDLKEHSIIRADVKNISLQKKIMETLERRNKDFSKVFDKASEFTYRIAMKDGYVVVEYVSEEFPELTGLSATKICDEKGRIDEYVHEDDIKDVKAHFKKIYEGNSCTCEYRIRNKEGGYIDIIDYGKPEWDNAENEVVCAKGAIITKPSK
ncbi:MAG: PAS domain S-box protein [Balneolaceae bacterium]|nr:PAS domain S-box protein [Balneolaceae bacterium]